MDRRADLMVAVIVLLASIAYFVDASNLHEPMKRDPVGMAGLPQVLAVVMAAGAAAVIVRRIVRWRSEQGNRVESDGQEDEAAYPATGVRPLVLWGLVMLYATALPILGFRVATPLMLVAALLVWDVRSWRLIAGVTAVLTVGLFLLFDTILGFTLP